MIKKQDIKYLILLSLISLLYLWGIKDVPFHPDESTQIFMSADFETIFTSFSSLFWEKENEADIRQYYHIMDAPLTRYVIGLGKWIGNQPDLARDWDWSQTWEENQISGSLPETSLLFASRLSVAVFFPISLFFIYLSSKKETSPFFGFVSALLFAVNSLIWLHTRRAMAESLLLFNITFFIFLSYVLKNSDFLFAVPAALAFNAKQSGIVVLILGVIEILRRRKSESIKSVFLHLLKYGSVFCLITILLNPFLWKHPIQAAKSALEARSEFTINQQNTYQQAAPGLVLETTGSRIKSFLYHTFLADPISAESGNYNLEQEVSVQNYFKNPLNLISNHLVFKTFFLLLSLSGFLITGLDLYEKKLPGPALTIWMGSLLFSVFLIIFLPLSFQRYYLPVLPFFCFHAGYSLYKLFNQTPDRYIPAKK